MEGINLGDFGYNNRYDEKREDSDLSPELKLLFEQMAISASKVSRLEAALNKEGLTLGVLNSPVEGDKPFVLESLSSLASSVDKESEDRIISNIVNFFS
jgi:hypothetical protein